ncbi:TPA: cobalt-precorrin 5A hydrolase [Enterococcus faecalis]|uniref:cobalt-precorrin 5A hydrolase n=2 Tax=Enterococcus faecalis TaxID=1351 RepID=UPI00215B887F|nr:cobalt-precorrin 5A hydrolase [Enterococcus faecalis]
MSIEMQKNKIAILTLTAQSYEQGQRLKERFIEADVSLFGLEKHVTVQMDSYPGGSFKKGFQHVFNTFDSMICIMATGIVVRHLASLIDDKRHDPAVVVMDEKANFSISLLSGHIGGGNDLAIQVANLMGAQPVITTATDVQNVSAIDVISQQMNGWYADFKETTKTVNGLLAAHKNVGLIDEEQLVKDTRGLNRNVSLDDDVSDYEAVILVSHKKFTSLPNHVYQLVPRQFILGMGAKKETSIETIETEYRSFCKLEKIHPMCVKKIVSIDLKKNEAGMITFSNRLNVPFETFTKEQLEPSSLKYPQSDFVKSVVGIGNVALASADYATNGQVLTNRYGHNGVTFALGKE